MKRDPIPGPFAYGETVMIGGDDIKNGLCRCGLPLWMHDRQKEYDDEGRYYYRTICPDTGVVLPMDLGVEQ